MSSNFGKVDLIGDLGLQCGLQLMVICAFMLLCYMCFKCCAKCVAIRDLVVEKKLRDERVQRIERKRTQRERAERENFERYQTVRRDGYFNEQINLGDQQIAAEDYVCAVDHFANALQVCDNPIVLWEILQATLPDTAYYMLIGRIVQFDRNPAPHPATWRQKSSHTSRSI